MSDEELETESPADRLLAAADLLDKRAGEATEGPWVYNGYSWVGAVSKLASYEDWDPGDGHSLERTGACDPCGAWREPSSCHNWPLGQGCRFFDQDYDMDPEVVSVRAHHGDTAVRSRAADAEWIAMMHPGVGKLLAGILRREAASARMLPPEVAEHEYRDELALADAFLADSNRA